jgi:hypothetical protein
MTLKLPPAPEGWNKTIADLLAEADAGLRPSVGSPEVEWARDYERSLLPPDTRFPCEGDVYEALQDFEAEYLTSWDKPFTGGGKAGLLKGEQVVVQYAPADSRPIMVYAHPVNYRDIEARVVPESERRAQSYAGFHFAISTADLNRYFRVIASRRGTD